jgi:hypothetical protein
MTGLNPQKKYEVYEPDTYTSGITKLNLQV